MNETDPDAGRGIFDTACALSVAGCAWTRHYLSTLQCLGLSHMVQEDVATETFRFGDGHGAQCTRRVTAPVVIANQPLMLRWHVLDGYKLSLLLGQDFIAQTGAIFDGKKHKLSIDGRTCSLGRSKRGHFSVNLNPEHYTALRAASLEGTRFEVLPRRVANPSRLGDLMSLICTSVEKLTEARTVNAASTRRDASSTEREPAYQKDASEMPCRVCYQHSTATCTSCEGPLCAACANGTRCALCVHGREEFHVGDMNYHDGDMNYHDGDSNYPHGDSNYPHGDSNYQHGDTCPTSAPPTSEPPAERPAPRYLKNGTTKILDAGVNTARALDKHRLVPNAIHNTLCLSHQREIHVTSQHATARHYSDVFVEWCCHPQSNLAEIAERQNFIVMRYDKSSQELDASSPQTVSRVIGLLRNHLNSGRRVFVWCSLPCTPWSTWQRLRPNTVKSQSE